MERNTTKIANIKAYLITALYNAPNTITHFYSAEVNHDIRDMLRNTTNENQDDKSWIDTDAEVHRFLLKYLWKLSIEGI